MQATAYLQQFFSSISSKPSDVTTKESEQDSILYEIADVSKKLENIKNRFNFETEYDMIDACIFEERALLSRYRHLITVAREKGITCTPVAHFSAFSQKD